MGKGRARKGNSDLQPSIASSKEKKEISTHFKCFKHNLQFIIPQPRPETSPICCYALHFS